MNKIPDTRVSLILRLSEASDVTAWHEFAEIYTPALLALVQRKGLQKADAEDVVQEILFGVARSVGRFEPDQTRATFRTWLCRIARNLVADFLAGKQRQLPSTEYDAEILAADRNCGHASSGTNAELDEEVRASIFRLAKRRVQQRVKDQTWRAFETTAIENLPAEQAARLLGMSVGNLYVAKCRVMKAIRAEAEQLLALEDASSSALEQSIANGTSSREGTNNGN